MLNFLPQTTEGVWAVNNAIDLPRPKSPLGDLGVTSDNLYQISIFYFGQMLHQQSDLFNAYSVGFHE